MASTQSLSDLMGQLAAYQGVKNKERGYPPVHLWNPDNCGDIGLEIRTDGSWWHEGIRITRQPLVDLFASVLRKDEDGQTWLVTPAEKVVVHVADAHFLGVRVDQIETSKGPGIAVATNTGDLIVIGEDNRLRVETDPTSGEPRPYVIVRGRLEARILRAPFYELVSWAEELDGVLSIESQGVKFDLGALSEASL
jgi:hypothetical protein